MGFLLTLRNHPDVRMYAKNNAPISEQEHTKWFADRLCRIDQEPYWVAILRENPLGFVRFDCVDSSTLKINIAILPQNFGQGFGSEVLKLAIDAVMRKPQTTTIRAEVHSNNQASLRLFGKVGFVEKSYNKGFITLDYNS